MPPRSEKRPRIGISLGDPCGIGAEVTVKALKLRRVQKALVPVLFGDASQQALFSPRAEFHVVSRLPKSALLPGKPTRAGGLAQLQYLDALIAHARASAIDGMCTAPVSKEQISLAGAPFFGHTEYLAQAFGVKVLMLMDGPRLRVALATHHLPLSAVPQALTRGELADQLCLLSSSLRPLLKRRPKLAVCGLNPHAGEGGLLGTEEQAIIAPAIADARARGVDAEGPFPADGLFSQWRTFRYDAVLAMFHDQALGVTKALDFRKTVNVTLGLPVPRSSPDHGVAYDLAGKNRADAVPMAEALLRAAHLTLRKR